MKTSLFNYRLPPELIAQRSVIPRDHARLMVLDRGALSWSHRYIYDLPEILRAGDILVFNNSKVIPARLIGKKKTGGKAELLLAKQVGRKQWLALTRPGLAVGQKLQFRGLKAVIDAVEKDGQRKVTFDKKDGALLSAIKQAGIMPTPPYITRLVKNDNEYQTVYAKVAGSVAAPTAGFHFTPKLFKSLALQGITAEFITLHVGLGTFLPIKTDDIKAHTMHEEYYQIPANVAKRLNAYKKEGRRIIAVGTTAVRTLESAVGPNGQLNNLSGWTKMFITPGYRFKFIDGLLTNFHLPKSRLLMLVSALAGRDFILKAYKEAVKKRYRFFSFGDAMLLL